jgi:hypothetical protein
MSEEFTTPANTIEDGIITKEESGPNWCQEKTRGL